MADKRIVMEARVLWVTDNDEATVQRVMEALDSSGVPGPVDFVQTAFIVGAPYIDFAKLGISEGYFEVRIEGPATWAIAYAEPAPDD